MAESEGRWKLTIDAELPLPVGSVVIALRFLSHPPSPIRHLRGYLSPP